MILVFVINHIRKFIVYLVIRFLFLFLILLVVPSRLLSAHPRILHLECQSDKHQIATAAVAIDIWTWFVQCATPILITSHKTILGMMIHRGAHAVSPDRPRASPYCAIYPPSITNSVPVTNEASSDARNSTP